MNDDFIYTENYLPASIKDLLLYISYSSVYLLIKEYGGTRIVLSKKVNTELVNLIGIDDYTKLSKLFDGGIFYCPRCLTALNLLRDRYILSDKRQGMTLSELARKNNLTERGISKILRRIEKQEYEHRLSNAQQDLFNC